MNLGPYACRAKQKLINFLRSVAHTFNYECNLKSLKLFSLLFWFFFAFDLFLFCVYFVNAREKLFYLEKKNWHIHYTRSSFIYRSLFPSPSMHTCGSQTIICRINRKSTIVHIQTTLRSSPFYIINGWYD